MKQMSLLHSRATIGADFLAKVVHWDENLTLRLQLWDIAGIKDVLFSSQPL